MNFWDLEDQSHSDFNELIGNPNVSIVEILNHDELINNFRNANQELLDYLEKESVLNEILNILFENADKKLIRIAVQLFTSESPLICTISNNFSFLEKIVEKIIVSCDYICAIIVRIISSCLARDKMRIVRSILDSPTIMPVLLINSNKLCISDFLVDLGKNSSIEDNFPIWTYTVICGGCRNPIMCPSPWNLYPWRELADSVTLKGVPIAAKKSLLNVMMAILKEKQIYQNMMHQLSIQMCSIIENEELIENTIDILFCLPLYPIVYSKLYQILNNKIINKAYITSLKIICDNFDESMSDLIPPITECFLNDNHNSIHHLVFIDFVKVCTYYNKTLEIMSSIILKHVKDIWSRNMLNRNKIGILLKACSIIVDSLDDSSNWDTFKKDIQAKLPNVEPSPEKKLTNIIYHIPENHSMRIENPPKVEPIIPELSEITVLEDVVLSKPITSEEPVPIIINPVVQSPSPFVPNSLSDLINHPYWKYNGPSFKELFFIDTPYDSVENALSHLVNDDL